MINKETADIKIVNLADYPQHMGTIIRWLWLQWGKGNGYTESEVEYRTRHCLLRDAVPMTLIALLGAEPAGTVSLWVNDLPYRQDLSPWLAVLYTDQQYRRRGVGGALIGAAVGEAKRLGYSRLYLETELDDYYERFGWQFVELAPEGGGKMLKIYQLNLED